MYTIIKIVGISPDALSRLHARLEAPDMRTQENHFLADGSSGQNSRGIVPYAVILESKFLPDSKKYAVSLRFNLTISHQDGTLFYPPLSAFQAIFEMINERLLPDSMTIEAEARRAAAEKARDEAKNELVNKIVNEIVDQMSEYDITNGKTGEIVIPCRRRITRTLIKSLVNQLADLDLGPPDTDDYVIDVLRRFQSEQKSAQQG